MCDVAGEALWYPSYADGKEDQPGWSSSISKPTKQLREEYPWLKFKPPEKVKTTTLDHWLRNHPYDSIDLVWMDVQGAEGLIIKGGVELFKRVRLLWVEIEPDNYEDSCNLDDIKSLLPDFTWICRSEVSNDHLFLNRARA